MEEQQLAFKIQTDSDEKKHSVRYIGPLTEEERLKRVIRYWQKKWNKALTSKFIYTCRKQVAEKRLRIKGRFVTKEQAFEILGLT